MKKNLPALAVISAAILWSLDGYIRQNLFSLPSFLIISLEHAIGAMIFFPLLIKGLNEIYSLNRAGYFCILNQYLRGSTWNIFLY